MVQTSKQKGSIIRVSGPVVEATGISVKMSDIVRVGDEQLMGEIIKIEENSFIIQVYEDTTGIKPGEPVIGTGRSLSVELGPGLLGSIYDGIQRPLQVLEKEMGHFITRGVNANGISHEKKWDFKPRVKKGDTVKPGQIIGEVQEYDIVHKIMATCEKPSKVKEIYQGSFTVEDKIGVLESKEELKLSVYQPVRTARPFETKLAPSIPLVTGQRIYDVFFPVAKGGVAALPGPFGAGKCVVGDTPIMMGDGTIKPIKQIYEENRGLGKEVIEDNEEYTTLNEPFTIHSHENGKIVQKQADTVYKGKTSKLIKITTQSGRQISVTPVHPLFKVNDKLEIKETQSQQLKIGDYLATPRTLEFEGEDIELSSVVDLEKIKSNTMTNKGHQITIPTTISKEFAKLLGYILGDGSLKQRSVYFYNNDETLIEEFELLINKLFGLHCKRTITNSVNTTYCNSKLLVEILSALGVPKTQKSKTNFVPGCILKSKQEVIGAFIGAYYLCDGYNREKDLEIYTASHSMQSTLSYAFLRLGILHSVKNKYVEYNNTPSLQYKIVLCGKTALTQFYTLCGFNNHSKFNSIYSYIASNKSSWTSKDPVPVSGEYLREFYENAGTPYTELKNRGVEIHNFIGKNQEIPSKESFTTIAKTLNDENLIKFATNHMEHIYCDKITSIEEINQNCDVYDITVPQTHNFVGGHAPMILHNTVTQQSIAKWSDADIVVYVGCGERGNEMTEVLSEFPHLIDPRTGKPMMERTILIANTSNMPVAAREASVYVGMSIAEYYRDMGYNVAMMADSTSRWAEAMREISSRLEEMPGEEGYPAYLSTRLANFYERAGPVKTINDETGSVTVIGAVSPAGGDFSEPVTQNTLRVSKCFWALDAKLAEKRHYWSINWLKSYSLYHESLREYFAENVDKNWEGKVKSLMNILQEEDKLMEIVQLVGSDSLPPSQQVTLETARIIREELLQQNAFHEVDRFCTIEKANDLMDLVLTFQNLSSQALEKGVPAQEIIESKSKFKIPEVKLEHEYTPLLENLKKEMKKEFEDLEKRYA